MILLLMPFVAAHQSGCHSRHSCPSDRGTYVCGDLGDCSRCPDNVYCFGSMPRGKVSPPPSIPAQPIISPIVPREPVTLPPIGPVSCMGRARCFAGVVNRVVDGDTLKIEGRSVRLALTSAPELKEPGGPEARDFTKKFCAGTQAVVDEDDLQRKGSYGRIVGVVYCNDKNLNQALLETGHGHISRGFCTKSEFARELWARQYGC